MADAAQVTIEQATGARGRKRFIRAAHAAFANDPAYVAPLEFEVDARIDPARNPGLDGADLALFIACVGGRDVGRISVLVNPLHLARWRDGAAHFGFLDAIDDAAVFAALLRTAEDFFRARGLKKSAGPFSFSVNEECGLLINGFDTPPYIMMPHGRPWYGPHVEAAGYAKAIDMHALRYIPRRQFIPERRMKFIERALSSPKVSIRNIDFRRFDQEIATLVDIFKDAWSDNWGFIPMTEAQIAHMARELRPVIAPYNVIFCELDGEPVAFGLALPNVMQAIRDFDGKLLPFNWAKLLWRLKVKKLPEARMPLMGVRKKLHGKPLGAAFAYKIIEMVNSANMDNGVISSELSWILETNTDMLTMLTDMGGEIYKTYRIYERGL